MNRSKCYEVIPVPLDIDMQQNEYNISVRFSKVAELLAAVHMLSDKNHHSFDADWTKHVIENISADSKSFLDELSSLNFPGLELFDFITREGIYDSIPLFIKKLENYNSLDFVHIILDEKLSKDQLKAAQKDERAFYSVYDEVPWVLKGSESFLRYMITDADNYKHSTIKLLNDIYSSGFEEKLSEQKQKYEDSIDALKLRLSGRNPIEVGEEIKGSKFNSKVNFNEYIFSPSYFFHHHNIISYNKNTYLMIYNINIDNSFDDGEAEKLSELLKVLSDKSRLEILRQLKRRPTYGKILSTRLNLTTATISRHLDQLKAINLIKEDKNNNVKYYYVNSDELEKLFDEIRRFLNKR
jgi:DNA-binding transcriptional ArsR family regulator